MKSIIQADREHCFALMLKQIVQKRAMDHYGWSVDDFIGIFGRNYIQEETRND